MSNPNRKHEVNHPNELDSIPDIPPTLGPTLDEVLIRDEKLAPNEGIEAEKQSRRMPGQNQRRQDPPHQPPSDENDEYDENSSTIWTIPDIPSPSPPPDDVDE